MSDNQQQPKPIICPQCGQTNAQGRQECWNCKGPLVQNAQPPAKKSSATCWIVGCLISFILAVILLVIGVAGYFFLRPGSGPGNQMEIEEAIRKSMPQEQQKQIDNEIKKEIEKQIMEDAKKGVR